MEEIWVSAGFRRNSTGRWMYLVPRVFDPVLISVDPPSSLRQSNRKVSDKPVQMKEICVLTIFASMTSLIDSDRYQGVYPSYTVL